MVLFSMGAINVMAQTLPYQDQSLSFHERAVDLVSRLTLKEKAQQMGNMVDTEVNRDGINLPMYQYWNEALHGVARSGAATSFPESKGMSSTWDRQLIFDCATAISDEARVYHNLYKKGLNYWCPTINMARDPRWGRDEENYGEDPFLAGQLAVQFIKGMQGNNPTYLKTVACAKHFAANNYEQGRQGSTSYMTPHILREYYLPAFEMSVKEGKVKSIMSSYNALSTDINETNAAGVKFGDAAAKGKAWGGKPNAMNDWLLNGILRNEWGFDGYVTSDCAGVSCIYRSVKHFYYGNIYGTYTDEAGEINDLYQAHATADAIKAGNDMNCEFKNKLSVFQTAVEAAIEKGFMTEADLDQALIRVLETRFALGEFDDSTPWDGLGAETLESEANQALALKAAQESIVLLKNEKGEMSNEKLLPLSTEKSVALIGPYANQIMLGDYSGTPTYTTTPFEAFKKKLNFELATQLMAGTLTAVPFTQAVVSQRGAANNDKGAGNLENTAPGDIFLYKDVEFGTLGCTQFEMSCGAKSNGLGQVSFILDNKDNEPFLTVDNKDTGGWTTWTTVTATFDATTQALLKGKHDLYVKFSGSNSYVGNYQYFHFSNPDDSQIPAIETQGPLYMCQTSSAVNEAASAEMIARAVAVAQKADVVVFLGGTDYSKPADHATGTESHDRFIITMPGNQTELLQAIYAVNPNVVLVLETNSSMDITWEKANLPAIIEAWYGGQAQGQAICDVLYGDVNPSGKLTSTWYNRLEELPSKTDSQFGADGMLEYNIDDWGYTYMYYGKGTGANVSRQAAAPMYPFGYGLSYTTFGYENLKIEKLKDESTEASCTITNTGSRKGAEVVQVYVSFPNSSVPHIKNMNRRLVGFERVELEPGESTTVTIPINKQQLAYWNDDTDELWVEGGTVNVYISASSADDRLTGSFTATAEKLAEAYKGGSEEPETPVNGISIPTAANSYISWDQTQNEDVTLTGASLENDGASIGSTGSSTVATFAIGNSTLQDYVLTFKTAAKDLTAEIEVTLTNSDNTKVLNKVAQVKNTGSWYFDGTETIHAYYLSELPKGEYTLRLATKSTTGKYAGNWGYLAFRTASSYDVIPGTLDLSKGIYSNNKMLENNGGNVGYIENGRKASYAFINNTAATYKMTMDICRYNQGGTMNILIENAETGAAEVNYDYIIAADAPGSYTSTDIPLPTAISKGVKRMTLTFSNGSSYICNFKAPTFTVIEEQQEQPEEPVVVTESVDIKNNEGTRENGVWTNGIYTLSTTSLDGYNQYFKMNGSDYTISLPADVVVKQLIFKECSNNYAGNNAQLVSVTSTGATCTLPEDTHFYHESEGDKHDIIVTIDGHSAGNDISFNLPKQGQPMCWIQLDIVKTDPGTAPAKTAEVVNVVRNHAVVTLTFDREIPNDVAATINGGTVTAEGGSAVLIFPIWGLDYATNYSLNIAAGAVTDNYGNSTTEAILVAVNTEAKPVVTKAAYDYVVSNATELDAALDELKVSNKTADAPRKTVFLKNGNYTYGTLTGSYQNNVSLKIDNWNNVYNVSLIGESKDGVIIEGTTDGITSSTLNLGYGTGIYLQDMTIRNNYDFPKENRFKGVSVAVSSGNKAVLKNVAMQACQDTYVTGKRTYLENCDIYGTVDFICGGGDIFFQSCDLILVDRGGDVIVAPNTTADTKWGYVFQYCTVKAEDGATAVTDKSWDLGRPWQNEPRAYYLNTTMEVLPTDKGWKNMSNIPTHFYEYNSMDRNGNALDLTVRGNSPSSTNHYTPVLTDAEALKFTVENVLGGTDSWLPTDECPELAAPTVTLNGTALSWTAVDDARCYVVFKNGAYLDNVTTTSYTIDDQYAGYSVRAANLNGGLGASSLVVSKPVSVTTGELGWATACLTYDAVVPAGTKAYYISSASGDAVTLTELTEIPAGEGFIFNAAKGEHEFAKATTTLAAISNLLVGILTTTSVEANSVYVLGKTSENKAAMMLYTGTSIAAGKAYLPASVIPNGARSLNMVFDDNTTGIQELKNSRIEEQKSYYNLQGCRVAQPVKGLYIKNGKIVIAK